MNKKLLPGWYRSRKLHRRRRSAEAPAARRCFWSRRWCCSQSLPKRSCRSPPFSRAGPSAAPEPPPGHFQPSNPPTPHPWNRKYEQIVTLRCRRLKCVVTTEHVAVLVK